MDVEEENGQYVKAEGKPTTTIEGLETLNVKWEAHILLLIYVLHFLAIFMKILI